MQWRRRVKPNRETQRFVQDERGQSLVVVVFSIIALIAIIGLGVDLGVVYAERVRLARAMDAAALAAAQELPTEEAAHQRALEYLRANGFDVDNACIETRGSGLGQCPDPDAPTYIVIDTEQFRSEGANSANRIKVWASQDVPLNFVRVIGFESAPITANATAENIEDLDIVVVYDNSGSMQEDTRCYGCWELDPVAGYPHGRAYPLPFGDHCEPSDPLEFRGHHYISIEAEHYSRYPYEADYHREFTEYPKIWWAMQREPDKNASGPDARGAWMMVGPPSFGALRYPTIDNIVHPPDFYTTPRLDYDFTVPVNGTYYVWMRAQGGTWRGGDDRVSHKRVHVGLNGVPMVTAETPTEGGYNTGAEANNWRWTSVLELPNLAADEVYTLNVWAAGPGFRLDKIVIANNPDDDLGSKQPLNWNLSGIPGAGPVETHGRGVGRSVGLRDWACPPDAANDPRFVPVDPETGELDDLYDDYQPIRFAKEAAKKFVRQLNPDLDQIAYVTYNTKATIREELYCKKRFGSCDDFERVLAQIEATDAGGNTNIADALWDGIRVLTTGREPPNDGQGFPSKVPGQQHFGRPHAAHILILMTDGQPNRYPGYRGQNPPPPLPPEYRDCYSYELWPDQPGEDPEWRRGRECMAWFAQQARDQGIVIFTIGLGAQADDELLEYVADITGGGYHYAPSGEQLDAIFESLYERIFLRLID